MRANRRRAPTAEGGGTRARRDDPSPADPGASGTSGARTRRALVGAAFAVFLGACPTASPGDDDDASGDDPGPLDDDDTGAPADDDSGPSDDDDSASGDDDATPAPSPTLTIRSLGVGGVSLRVDDDLLLTAPLYSNPDLAVVTLEDVVPDTELIDAFFPVDELQGAAGIVVGHGHYDHLLDVPYVAALVGDPPIYGNRAVHDLIGGSVVLNDPGSPRVDMRMCPEPDPCTGVPADGAGEWVGVPDSRIRLRALCSMHPAQFLGIIHFGEGCTDGPATEPPAVADAWKEGATLAYLIDFLDESGAPTFRVYYQDAPTDGPYGHAHPDLLADKRVDVAVLNVGSYDAVADHPGAILANLDPRYVLGVHWESFFDGQDEPIVPIPFHAAPAGFDVRVEIALPVDDEPPVLRDGDPSEGRYWRPWPGTRFEFPAEGSVPPPDFAVTSTTEVAGDSIALRTNLPATPEDCLALGEPDAPCADVDADGLVDAWEDEVLDRLRPLVRFDEAEPLFADLAAVVHSVGRVAPAPDSWERVRAFIMIGYSEDYGRCGATMHDGDSERVALDLAFDPDGSPGDVLVVGTYTAAHEGTITDHSLVLGEAELAGARFEADAVTGAPRWVVFSSDGKHATYHSIDACEDAEWAPCIEEDCAPDNVDDVLAFDLLPPIVNAGEEDAPRWSDLTAIGFAGDEAWVDQPFCGGQGAGGNCSSSVLSKLVIDPFE